MICPPAVAPQPNWEERGQNWKPKCFLMILPVGSFGHAAGRRGNTHNIFYLVHPTFLMNLTVQSEFDFSEKPTWKSMHLVKFCPRGSSLEISLIKEGHKVFWTKITRGLWPPIQIIPPSKHVDLRMHFMLVKY